MLSTASWAAVLGGSAKARRTIPINNPEMCIVRDHLSIRMSRHFNQTLYIYRFSRPYKHRPELVTGEARPALQDLDLIPVFTDEELPLD